MDHFTPLSGFVGGLLIGGAASLYVLLNGRVLGISGILGGAVGAVLGGGWRDLGWRVALLAGVVLGPLAWGAAGGPAPGFDPPRSAWLLVAGGLLVGFGSRMGNGCTSGHGICGLARGSRRSLAATAAFFAAAVVTVFVVRHVAGG